MDSLEELSEEEKRKRKKEDYERGLEILKDVTDFIGEKTEKDDLTFSIGLQPVSIAGDKGARIGMPPAENISSCLTYDEDVKEEMERLQNEEGIDSQLVWAFDVFHEFGHIEEGYTHDEEKEADKYGIKMLKEYLKDREYIGNKNKSKNTETKWEEKRPVERENNIVLMDDEPLVEIEPGSVNVTESYKNPSKITISEREAIKHEIGHAIVGNKEVFNVPETPKTEKFVEYGKRTSVGEDLSEGYAQSFEDYLERPDFLKEESEPIYKYWDEFFEKNPEAKEIVEKGEEIVGNKNKEGTEIKGPNPLFDEEDLSSNEED